MTLNFEFTDKDQIEEIKAYMEEVLDYIDLDKDWIPASVQILDNTISVFVTEEFFRFTYQYFLNILITDLASAIPHKVDRLKKIAKEYRKGVDDMLMFVVKDKP